MSIRSCMSDIPEENYNRAFGKNDHGILFCSAEQFNQLKNDKNFVDVEKPNLPVMDNAELSRVKHKIDFADVVSRRLE